MVRSAWCWGSVGVWAAGLPEELRGQREQTHSDVGKQLKLAAKVNPLWTRFDAEECNLKVFIWWAREDGKICKQNLQSITYTFHCRKDFDVFIFVVGAV